MHRWITGLVVVLILAGCGSVSNPSAALWGHWDELNSQLETRDVTLAYDRVYYIEGEQTFQCWAYDDGTLIIFPPGRDLADPANQRWAMDWEGQNQVILSSNGERVTLRRTSTNSQLSPAGRQLVIDAGKLRDLSKLCPTY
jgi:hypothetical protein